MFKRDLIILAGVVVLALALTVGIFAAQRVQTGSWGLSFSTEGATPKGPASAQILANYDAAYVGDATEKVIYLTFDAGYENGCTEKILDILKKHDAPAAFFLVGNYMKKD